MLFIGDMLAKMQWLINSYQGEYIIVGDEEDKNSFSITDSGLLFTKVRVIGYHIVEITWWYY